MERGSGVRIELGAGKKFETTELSRGKRTFFDDLPDDVQKFVRQEWREGFKNIEVEAPKGIQRFFYDFRPIAGEVDKRIITETWEDELGVDLRRGVVPEMVKTYKIKHGRGARMPILIPGSGMGFANDQLRNTSDISKSIYVFGTNLEEKKTENRKRQFFEEIRQGKFQTIKDTTRQEILSTVSPKLHQHDRMWPNLLLIPKDRRFPLIADVYGDLENASWAYKKEPRYFQESFKAALELLESPGRMYIAHLHPAAQKFVVEYCQSRDGVTCILESYESEVMDRLTNRLIIQKA